MASKTSAVDDELFALGIFVHDYALYTTAQLNQILPILRSMPRLSIRSEGEGGGFAA